MTNTLLASVTTTTDGTSGVSSADRNFYPEYGIAQFRATTQDNYSFDVSGLTSTANHLYNPGLNYSNSYRGFPSNSFAQQTLPNYGNYSNFTTFATSTPF